ncbi:hypothetical protein G6O67_002646 [Ophiocordyceps sinensis]|uniref:Sucrose transport protein n=1 Tax=Ophiocordyceps sinensis TaxID=72228 RepID=A0A8H4PUQ2_9HYPO|nr:hypothetical protein G6O67_002646 [Ophiocordyceps sinensis]
MATLVGEQSVKGSTETTRLLLLTFVSIGVTFTWGVEMTYCTPYLLNLGLTKSNTSLIWIAGPLSGLIVQPIVGVVADENTSKWGRRRPLMAVGAVVVAAGLVLMGFTRELVGLVIGQDDQARRPAIVLAVLSIYIVDFAINVVQSCARSLVVDTLPLERQQTGAAWTSRMCAIGHVIGYAAGSVDLVALFGTTLGHTQFQQLTVIAAVAILGSAALTCWAVTERVLVSADDAKSQSIANVLRQIHHTLRHLSPRIQAICWSQFWAWIGWFPFLFYSTTWVGETYYRYDVPALGKQSQDALGDIGRIGSLSLFLYSTLTTVAAFALPLLVKSPDDASFTHRPPPAIAGLVKSWNERKPDLETTWMCGHLVFAASMVFAPLAKSFRFATALMCLCALPWAIATWAPPALLGVEVNKLSGATENGGAYRRLSGEPDIEMSPVVGSANGRLYPETAPPRPGTSKQSTTAELSGIYFGILNIYTALPQFVGAFIASIVFAVLEPGGSPELAADAGADKGPTGPSAISVCLFIGALSALVAAFATRKLKRL